MNSLCAYGIPFHDNLTGADNSFFSSYVMAIGEAEAFSERMKRELVALESANVYALLETESVVEEVCALLNFFDKGI
jgi:hypothetical protein